MKTKLVAKDKKTKTKCCKYHDNFWYKGTDLWECGTAGRGTPTLCCPDCPRKEYYDKIGIIPDYYIDDIKKGLTQENEKWLKEFRKKNDT